jgi:hypothetical protein
MHLGSYRIQVLQHLCCSTVIIMHGDVQLVLARRWLGGCAYRCCQQAAATSVFLVLVDLWDQDGCCRQSLGRKGLGPTKGGGWPPSVQPSPFLGSPHLLIWEESEADLWCSSELQQVSFTPASYASGFAAAQLHRKPHQPVCRRKQLVPVTMSLFQTSCDFGGVRVCCCCQCH